MASWTPLESNPNVINPMIEKMGVKGVKAVDVYDFSDQGLKKPQFAVLLCFPEYKKVDEIVKPIYENSQPANASVFFMKQKIPNACGTFALFHALANLEGRIDVGDGSFGKWLEGAKKLGTDERSDLLAADKELSAIHASAAEGGQSAQPEEVNHHYMCYVVIGERLYELDSRRPFARDIGGSSEDTLVNDVGNACQFLIQKLDNVSFSAVALVKA